MKSLKTPKTPRAWMVLYEQELEYWHDVFKSRGYERDVAFEACVCLTWFQRGDFHVGYDADDFRDRIIPHFMIVYHGHDGDRSVNIRVTITGFETKFTQRLDQSEFPICTVSEFLFVLDALGNTQSLPLCIGITWIEPLVAVFLRHSAAGITSTEKTK